MLLKPSNTSKQGNNIMENIKEDECKAEKMKAVEQRNYFSKEIQLCIHLDTPFSPVDERINNTITEILKNYEVISSTHSILS